MKRLSAIRLLRMLGFAMLIAAWFYTLGLTQAYQSTMGSASGAIAEIKSGLLKKK